MAESTDYKEQANQLCQKIGLAENSSHKDLRKNFISYIKKQVREDSDPTTQEDRQAQLEDLCKIYFDYHKGYIESIAPNGGKSEGDHEEAGRVKSEAGAITRGVGKAIIQFATCELELYTTMLVLDQDIEQARGDVEEEHRDIEWSYDLPDQIAVSCRRRDMLSIYMARINKAKPIVALLDLVFKFLDRALSDLLDAEQAKKLIDDFIGHLRKKKFSLAETVFDQIAEKESKAFFRKNKKQRREQWVLVVEISKIITELVQKKVKQLVGREDNIFLRNFEVRLAYDDMEKQLLQAREYIAKYQVPEIRYRREALDREKERLYNVDSFETLLDSYERLEKSCKFPMKTLKDVRSFEAEIYGEAKKIIGAKSDVVEQTSHKIEELSKGPNPEAVPDDALFSGEGT